MTGRIEVTAPATELGRVLAPRIGSSANVVSDDDRSGCLVVLTGKTDRELGTARSVVESWLGDERLGAADVHVAAGPTGWSRRGDSRTRRERLVALVLRDLLPER